MERQARSRVQTGATVVAHRPPIPPAIKRNTLLLAVTQAFVGVGNQALAGPDREHSVLHRPVHRALRLLAEALATLEASGRGDDRGAGREAALTDYPSGGSV
jgi:hypothetical protein